MNAKVYIHAAQAPGREGLSLDVTRLEGPGEDRLVLRAGNGAMIIALGAEQGFFLFGYGKARIDRQGGEAGRAFVDEVARWLGLEVEPLGDRAVPSAPAEALDASWIRLGDAADAFGARWKGFKLALRLGVRYAEVFLRLSDDGARAQLVEKWSAYRQALVEIFERTVGVDSPGAAARRVAPRKEPLAAPGGEILFGMDGDAEIAVPQGFRLTRQEGHYRLADADDEMMIELSSMRLPPLPPDAPDVVARLRAALASERREGAHITAFDRDGFSAAWTEYRFDSSDTKQPEAPPRPAIGRMLVASNEWVQVLVTGCWWVPDLAAAVCAWDVVVASLRLEGRVSRARGVEAGSA